MVPPVLDESFDLTPDGARRVDTGDVPRLTPEKVARMDWHNDVSRLILDINDALRATPDDRSRAVLIRRLRDALPEGAGERQPRRKSGRAD